MLTSLREADRLQLVADLMLGIVGTGTDSYGQGNQGGYGQDSGGEQFAVHSRPALQGLIGRLLTVLGQPAPAVGLPCFLPGKELLLHAC